MLCQTYWPDAVGSCEDVEVIDDGATAVESPLGSKCHHPGVLIHTRRPSSNDPLHAVWNTTFYKI